MTDDTNLPAPAPKPPPTVAETTDHIRRALAELVVLRVAFDEAFPYIDAAAEALGYVKSNHEDLARAKRALDRALTALKGIR